MKNYQTKIETNLFRNQQIFSIILAISSLIIICVPAFLDLVITDVEFFEDLLLLFTLLYLFVFIVGYSFFFILNIIQYKKYKFNQSKKFLISFMLIFLFSLGYFFILIYFMNDGSFNFLMAPRDTGIFLFHSIFIWINFKIHRISEFNT